MTKPDAKHACPNSTRERQPLSSKSVGTQPISWFQVAASQYSRVLVSVYISVSYECTTGFCPTARGLHHHKGRSSFLPTHPVFKVLIANGQLRFPQASTMSVMWDGFGLASHR
ncbi:hypothetical protein BaRGS_00028016 [Batillaria attramentaria]|uniref:Uncharacterized protein n=1 Tax=Batillaria attramentaria TaxID=370345 RepID=A0ABD0K057_9CAEN